MRRRQQRRLCFAATMLAQSWTTTTLTPMHVSNAVYQIPPNAKASCWPSLSRRVQMKCGVTYVDATAAVAALISFCASWSLCDQLSQLDGKRNYKMVSSTGINIFKWLLTYTFRNNQKKMNRMGISKSPSQKIGDELHVNYSETVNSEVCNL